MFNTHICRNCFKSYSGKPEVCPNCGAQIEYKKKKEKANNNELEDNMDQQIQEQTQELQKKERRKKKKHLSSKEIMDSISFEDLLNKTNDNDVRYWREKRKKREKIDANIDENGQINVDVKDVSYLPETYTYSVKKARGDYKNNKIKWWEVYKWADMMLARRKVQKQVSKASTFKPEPIRYGTILTLCILFGWLGLHNFYARNYRKAWFIVFCAVFGTVVVFVPFFAPVRISIGGGLLFIVVFMWGLDTINLILGHYGYRLSKWKFIDSLNIDTRAKLGYKYIDLSEYKKPWYVRIVNSWKRASQERKLKKQMTNNDSNDDTEQNDAEVMVNQTDIAENTTVVEQKETKSTQKVQNKKKNNKKQVKITKNKKA